MPEPRVQTGIVAIGRNEGERLIRCLQSLRDSGCPVVYVDSASTDGSQQAAARLGAQVVSLDMDRPFTAARARAEGFAALEASYPDIEYVFFVDGDCEVDAGFLPAAEQFLRTHPDHAVVCGRRRERFPEASRYNMLIDREWDTQLGEAEACGGDAVYRCGPYRDAGGFDPAMLAGEEPELCSRLRKRGWRVFRMDAAMTVHDAAITRYSQWWQRAVRSGMGYAQAWAWTRGNGMRGLYARELARALGWAGALPAAAIVLAIVGHPLAILLWPGVTGLQFVRLAHRDGAFAAFLSVSGKYAELMGIARYALRRLAGRSGNTVSYK